MTDDDEPGLTLPALFVCCLFSLPVWALVILAVGGDLMRELFVMAVLTFGLALLWYLGGWLVLNFY